MSKIGKSFHTFVKPTQPEGCVDNSVKIDVFGLVERWFQLWMWMCFDYG